MGLIWADGFMSSVALYRTCYIKGRFGSGKTLLSLYIAQWLVAHGWAAYVASNIPINGAVPPHQFPVPFQHAAIIIDEAFLYLDNWTVAKRYLAFARKFNHFFIMPSVWAVSPRLRVFGCERFFNFYPIGIPLWVYRWWLDGDNNQQSGYFGLFKPHLAYGMYNTAYMPADDGGIQDAIKKTMLYYGFKEGRLGLDDLALEAGEDQGIIDATDGFDQAARRIERSARNIRKASRR